MFIVWGTKLRYPALGYLADFCPFCRGLREFRVREIRKVSHLYYVSLGRGKLVGYRLDCTDCGAHLHRSDVHLAGVSRERSASIEDSVRSTNPSLPEHLADRLSLEQDIRRGLLPTDPELRAFLLHEPFEELSVELEQGCKDTRVDLPSAFGCLGTIGLIAASIFAVSFIAETFLKQRATDEWIVGGVLAAGAIGIAYTLWQLHRATSRWLRRRMVPKLIRALEPLHPTSAELEHIINSYRLAGFTFPKHLRISFFGLDPAVPSAPLTVTPQAVVPK